MRVVNELSLVLLAVVTGREVRLSRERSGRPNAEMVRVCPNFPCLPLFMSGFRQNR